MFVEKYCFRSLAPSDKKQFIEYEGHNSSLELETPHGAKNDGHENVCC